MSQQKKTRLRGVPPELTASEKVVDMTGGVKFIDKHITDSKCCRTLGLNLLNNLSWEGHISSGKRAILPCARRQLGRLHKLRDSLSSKVKLQLCNSLVISHLTYGICLWGQATNNHLRQIQVLLNQATQFVTGMDKTARKIDLMVACGWLDINELVAYHTLVQLFKTVRWGTPAMMFDRFELVEDNLLSTK